FAPSAVIVYSDRPAYSRTSSLERTLSTLFRNYADALFATEAQSHGATLDAVGACQRQAERSGGQSWKRTTGTGGRPSFVSTIAHLTRRCAAPRRAHVLGLWGSDRVLLCGSVTLWPKWSPE